MIDINLLKSLLRQGAYATLSDAEAAVLASAPILTLRAGRVTFTSLGSIWGLARAATFRATLKALAANADATIAATADYALGVLSGDGFDAGHPEAAKAGAVFVQLGAATAEEIQDSQYTVSYPAGDVVGEKDVTAARAGNVRQDAIFAVEQRVRGVYASFANERINTAASDPALPVPTYAEFLDAVTKAGEA